MGTSTGALVPTFNATLTLGPARLAKGRLTAIFGEYLTPVVDQIYGGVSEMLATNATLIWTKGPLAIQLTGFGNNSAFHYGHVAILTTYGVSQTAIYQLDRHRHWSVTAGCREAWQESTVINQQPILFAGFLGLTYTTGPMHLQ